LSRRDNATIALYVVADEEDDSVEIARQRQETEERRDRNKKWREQKEFKESGKEAPKKKKKIDKNTRNRMVDKELRCRNCRDNLDKEVWECPDGHGFCGDCVDTNRINETEGDLEQGSDGVFRNKDFSSLRRILNNDNNEDTLWLVTRGEGHGESEKTGENEEEDTLWKFKKDEEEDSLPPYDISVNSSQKHIQR